MLLRGAVAELARSSSHAWVVLWRSLAVESGVDDQLSVVTSERCCCVAEQRHRSHVRSEWNGGACGGVTAAATVLSGWECSTRRAVSASGGGPVMCSSGYFHLDC
eukprot:TRINITY_DN11404_c0_g2_i1.p1 TRINITY_DN11404_c0_g2~~TRINITY_DN11404_c0_g2_i1.p1  ORF type:complete len:105 (-),score=15.14 TRINITY_DN11404_c0_g2_i1:93-407(-)